MSDDMKIIYEQDVAVFYETFTGKPVPTDENGQTLIKRFDEIPLREYHKNDKCKPEGMFTQTYEGSLKDEKLFQKYAIHMTKMMNTMNKNQDKLLAILKQLFIFPKGMEKKKKEKKKEEIKKEEEESKAPETQGNLALPNMQAPAGDVVAPAGADKTAVEADKTAVEQAPAALGAAALGADVVAQAPAGDKPADVVAQAPAADKPADVEAPAKAPTADVAPAEASAVKVETKVGGEGEAAPEEAAAVEVKADEIAKPAEVNPVDEIAEVKPADEIAKPADEIAKTAEVKPAETKPAEVKPAETKPAEVKESEVKESEVKESEVKPDEIDETAVIINPNLDDELLQSLINTTRKLIVELYITCEKDFLEGISIFESIVAVQLAKTTGSQIKLLNDMTMEYLAHNL